MCFEERASVDVRLDMQLNGPWQIERVSPTFCKIVTLLHMHLFSFWHSIASTKVSEQALSSVLHIFFSPSAFKCKFLSGRNGKVMMCWNLQAGILYQEDDGH